MQGNLLAPFSSRPMLYAWPPQRHGPIREQDSYETCGKTHYEAQNSNKVLGPTGPTWERSFNSTPLFVQQGCSRLQSAPRSLTGASSSSSLLPHQSALRDQAQMLQELIIFPSISSPHARSQLHAIACTPSPAARRLANILQDFCPDEHQVPIGPTSAQDGAFAAPPWQWPLGSRPGFRV